MAFGFESTTDEVIAGVDLTGRVALVTGASTGIGLDTARAIAAAGASVTLAARDAAKLAAAADTVREKVAGAQVDTGMLDLADLGSVRAFSAEWLGAHDRLHLLVNNAGIMFAPYGHT